MEASDIIVVAAALDVGCDCSTDIPPIRDNYIVSHAASIADPSTLLIWGNIGYTKKGEVNFHGMI